MTEEFYSTMRETLFAQEHSEMQAANEKRITAMDKLDSEFIAANARYPVGARLALKKRSGHWVLLEVRTIVVVCLKAVFTFFYEVDILESNHFEGQLGEVHFYESELNSAEPCESLTKQRHTKGRIHFFERMPKA